MKQRPLINVAHSVHDRLLALAKKLDYEENARAFTNSPDRRHKKNKPGTPNPSAQNPRF